MKHPRGGVVQRSTFARFLESQQFSTFSTVSALSRRSHSESLETLSMLGARHVNFQATDGKVTPCHRHASTFECIGRAGIANPVSEPTKQDRALSDGQSQPWMVVCDFYRAVFPLANKHLQIFMVGGIDMDRFRCANTLRPLFENDVHISFRIAIKRSIFHALISPQATKERCQKGRSLIAVSLQALDWLALSMRDRQLPLRGFLPVPGELGFGTAVRSTRCCPYRSLASERHSL